MKSVFLFIVSLGLYSLCSAQNPTGQSSGGTSGSDTTNPDQQQDYNPYIEPTQPNENSDGWNRSDYYEGRKEPENIRYYSGGHRGTNIINDENDKSAQYRGEDLNAYRGESQFPDIVRYYSGGYYGNNIINKEGINRTKSYYYGDPSSSDLNPQDSYQPR